jgi:hypothetical protein
MFLRTVEMGKSSANSLPFSLRALITWPSLYSLNHARPYSHDEELTTEGAIGCLLRAREQLALPAAELFLPPLLLRLCQHQVLRGVLVLLVRVVGRLVLQGRVLSEPRQRLRLVHQRS